MPTKGSLGTLEKLRENEECVKCGFDQVQLKHYDPSVGFAAEAGFVFPEHVAVCCARCGYVWQRLPLDAK